MRLLDERDVDELISAEIGRVAAAQAAEAAADGDVAAGRVDVANDHAWMRFLGGMVHGRDLLGFKQFHRVGKDVRYHIFVFRESSGEPLGIVDGRRITSLRTASTAALAVQHGVGDRGPYSLALIGSGEEAREGIRAVVATSQVKDAVVYSPTPENRDRFAAEMSEELGIDVAAGGSVADVLGAAQVAYVATGASDPFVTREDSAHLWMLAAVGATRRQHRELHGDVLAEAGTVVVDCRDAVLEPGDAIDAREKYGYQPQTALLLGSWLRGAVDAGQIIFKSVGSVEQDLVLAASLLEEAEARDTGRTVAPIASLRRRR